MTLDIAKELQKTFDEAVMQHEARSLKQGQDWRQAREIIERGKADRAMHEDKYAREFDTRVEIVRKRLINEAGSLNHEHPSPGGRDRFDHEAIDRQAHREVRLDHERVLQQSHAAQDQAMLALQEGASQRDVAKTQGKARGQFTTASDRRQQPERSPNRSR